MGNFSSKPAEKDLEKQVKKEMEDWEVDLYRNNPHLYYIPQLTKEKKRKEIRNRLGLED